MFDFAEIKGRPVPELALAEARAKATMTDHVRMMVDEGYFAGDPNLIGHALWSSLHGVVVLHLAGKLNGEIDLFTLAGRDAPRARQRLSRQNSRFNVMRQVRPTPGSAARLA